MHRTGGRLSVRTLNSPATTQRRGSAGADAPRQHRPAKGGGGGGGATLIEVKIVNAVRIGADAANAAQITFFGQNGPFLVVSPMHINGTTQQYEPDFTIEYFVFPPDHILVDRFQLSGESIFSGLPTEPTFYIATVPPRGWKLLFGQGLAMVDAPLASQLCT